MSAGPAPNVIVLAGPNGAGKSTIAQSVLGGTLGIRHFVNADTLARGLSGWNPEEMAFKAGKLMLEHLRELSARRASFAFETTLASRTFAPWLRELRRAGYLFHLLFLWLPTADAAVQRVRDRVSLGGHDVPEETVRRRYVRGLENFFRLYEPLADYWKFYDNVVPNRPRLVAEKGGTIVSVQDAVLWQSLRGAYAP